MAAKTIQDIAADPEVRQQLQSIFQSDAFKEVYQAGISEFYQQELRKLKESNSVEEVYRAQGAVVAIERIYALPGVLVKHPLRRVE